MMGTEGAGQELRAEQICMFQNRESEGLLVDVVAGCHLMAASENPEGLVLDGLQALSDDALLNNRSPHPRGIRER